MYGGGNPFNIFEDVWNNDNRHGTGWNKVKLAVLEEYYSYRKEKRDKMPKKRGFYVEHNPFRMEWDEELEKNG